MSLFGQLARTEVEEDARRLRHESLACGATALGDCRDRGYYTVRGVLASVTLPPRSGTPTVSADLFDGSGHLTLVWMGRRLVPGIHPGVRMRVEGRVSQRDSEMVMLNPTFHVLAPANPS